MNVPEHAADEAKAVTPELERAKCDHICLLDDGHVDRGELHFYGYELPSPRSFREHSVILNRVAWKIAKTLGKVTDKDESYDSPGVEEELDELLAALGGVPAPDTPPSDALTKLIDAEGGYIFIDTAYNEAGEPAERSVCNEVGELLGCGATIAEALAAAVRSSTEEDGTQ